MSVSKWYHLTILALFISFLLLVETNDEMKLGTSDGGSSTSTAPIMNCGEACGARCRLSSRPNLCKRACGTCCTRCNCVPPGTSGNQQLCPCYYSMTTRGGRRKCP